MNTQILNKLIEELKKDKPDHSYMRGILETLVESNQSITVASQWQTQPSQPFIMTTSDQPELIDETTNYSQAYKVGPVAEL